MDSSAYGAALGRGMLAAVVLFFLVGGACGGGCVYLVEHYRPHFSMEKR